MSDALRVVLIVQIVIFSIVILLLSIYFLPILLIRRFHTSNNILVGNFCLTGIICAIYWLTNKSIHLLNPIIFEKSITMCLYFTFMPQIVNCSVVHSLVMIIINRCFSIIYSNKNLFKKLVWSLLSSIVQWIVSVVLSIPFFLTSYQTCLYNNRLQVPWIYYYVLLINVIVPSIINIVFNSIIFFFVRSSTRRVLMTATITSSIKDINSQQHSRDLNLLKHISFIFIVFIIGWGPFYIVLAIDGKRTIQPWIYLLLQILPVISAAIQTLDLFMYNREVRQYLQQQFFNFFQ
ncbi:hypothetical protein I4U23_004709 [Adineta vaga]|nr:hypothetical protein I4U23_004709 [Adineta vaga]